MEEKTRQVMLLYDNNRDVYDLLCDIDRDMDELLCNSVDKVRLLNVNNNKMDMLK